MLMMLIPMSIYLLLSTLIIFISFFTSNKNKINFEKMSPFESGFNPMSKTRIPFSMRFFLITIIFLIFDVEIALFLPMLKIMKMVNMEIWILTSLMFLMILLIGLIHEWKNGILNWM